MAVHLVVVEVRTRVHAKADNRLVEKQPGISRMEVDEVRLADVRRWSITLN